MSIAQVKVLPDNRILIEAVKGNDTVRLVSSERPRPEFKAAMAGLPRVIAEMVDMPDDWCLDGTLTATALTVVDRIGDANLRVQIAAAKSLDTVREAFRFRTPAMWQEPEAGQTAGLSPEACKVVRAVLAEAQAYFDGQRAQGALAL